MSANCQNGPARHGHGPREWMKNEFFAAAMRLLFWWYLDRVSHYASDKPQALPMNVLHCTTSGLKVMVYGPCFSTTVKRIDKIRVIVILFSKGQKCNNAKKNGLLFFLCTRQFSVYIYIILGPNPKHIICLMLIAFVCVIRMWATVDSRQ